ncbi:MAG: hypothetical protein H0V32_08630 [Nocardioidaceae bacterium]|nr:hypothetical protein [Nocardioidaceae bacterium]MDQ3324452.1 endonuclease domain-containing protein [Actinomycetota bacterium]
MVAPTVLPESLLGRPFTIAAAGQHGVSRRVLAGKRFHRLVTGVYVHADVELTVRVWAQAALLVTAPDAVVTGVTGLQVRGVYAGSPWPLRLVSIHPYVVRRPGLAVTRVRVLPPHDVWLADPAHCLLAACRAGLDLVDAVAAGDALVHRGHCDLASLTDCLRAGRGAGSTQARRVSHLMRARVESPRETYARLLLVLAGLPEPTCNPNLGGDAGFIGRADLAYPEYAVIVEYDGRQHAEQSAQWERDLDRLDDFEAASWRFVRVTRQRLRRPRAVVFRVYSKLIAGGYSGPPPVFDPEWVALFERRSAALRTSQTADPRSWALCADAPRGHLAVVR